jgi:Leucine-rich repeat (LRR) protein
MKLYRKGIAILAGILLFGSFVLSGGLGLAAPDPTDSPQPTVPAATATAEPEVTTTFPPTVIDPTLPFTTTDATVNIPDSKLKAALYAATGIASGTAIKRSDLAKLGGGLDLSGKGIAKAEGLQYCENITDLNLAGNSLTDLPTSFSRLTKLKNLILDKNKFTKMPDTLFTIIGLTSLSMRDHEKVTKVPDKINLLAMLVNLDLSGCGIESVATNISKLSQLKTLNLSANNLKTIAKEVFLLPALENLDLSDNLLKELPKEAATMPRLVVLNVEENILAELPAGLGSAPSLLQVYAAVNRLTIIEPTLLAGQISHLTLDVNRLTDLPQSLAGKTFAAFSIEWNFIDMSEGSDARKIADSVNVSAGKAYLRQLQFLTEPQAKATTTTAWLQWPMLQDGTDGDCTWKVNKYQIYIDKDGTWGSPIAELDKLATQYVATGLKSDSAYKFQVGVEYSLSLNGKKLTHRYFTPVETNTLSTSATAEITPEPTAEETAPVATVPQEPVTTGTEEPDPSVPASGGNKTMVVVLIIIGAVAVLAVGGVAAMMMARRNRRPY